MGRQVLIIERLSGREEIDLADSDVVAVYIVCVEAQLEIQPQADGRVAVSSRVGRLAIQPVTANEIVVHSDVSRGG